MIEFGRHMLCDQCKGTGRAHVVRNSKRVRYTEYDSTLRRWTDFPCPACGATGIMLVRRVTR